MARKASREDKARLAMWMVVIEFSLKAICDELEMDKLITTEISDQLVRFDLGMEVLRRQLGGSCKMLCLPISVGMCETNISGSNKSWLIS